MKLLTSVPDELASLVVDLPLLVNAEERSSQVIDLSFWWDYAQLTAECRQLSEWLKVTLLYKRSICSDPDREIAIDMGLRTRTDGLPGDEYVIKSVRKETELLSLLSVDGLRIIPTSWILTAQGAVPYEFSSMVNDEDQSAYQAVTDHTQLGMFLDAFYQLLESHHCVDLFGLKVVLPSRPQLDQNVVQIEDKIKRELIIRNIPPPKSTLSQSTTPRTTESSTPNATNLQQQQPRSVTDNPPAYTSTDDTTIATNNDDDENDTYQCILLVGKGEYVRYDPDHTHPRIFNMTGNAVKWLYDLSHGQLRPETTEFRFLTSFSSFDIIVPENVDVVVKIQTTYSTCVVHKSRVPEAKKTVLVTGSLYMSSLNVWSELDPARPKPTTEVGGPERSISASSGSSRAVAATPATPAAPAGGNGVRDAKPLPVPPRRSNTGGGGNNPSEAGGASYVAAPPAPKKTKLSMGTENRKITDVLPREWKFELAASTMRLDLSEAQFQPGETVFKMDVSMSSFIIRVPVGVDVEPLFENAMSRSDVRPVKTRDGRYHHTLKLIGSLAASKLTVGTAKWG